MWCHTSGEISAEGVEDILDEVETRRRWPLHAHRPLDEALQWKRALTVGKWEDKLIGMELTLDTGKKLQSMPEQITDDPSIVSKVCVVVLAVPLLVHGQYFEAFAPHMKPGTIVL